MLMNLINYWIPKQKRYNRIHYLTSKMKYPRSLVLQVPPIIAYWASPNLLTLDGWHVWYRLKVYCITIHGGKWHVYVTLWLLLAQVSVSHYLSHHLMTVCYGMGASIIQQSLVDVRIDVDNKKMGPTFFDNWDERWFCINILRLLGASTISLQLHQWCTGNTHFENKKITSIFGILDQENIYNIVDNKILRKLLYCHYYSFWLLFIAYFIMITTTIMECLCPCLIRLNRGFN